MKTLTVLWFGSRTATKRRTGNIGQTPWPNSLNVSSARVFGSNRNSNDRDLSPIAYEKANEDSVDRGAHIEQCSKTKLAEDGKFCFFDIKAIPNECSRQSDFGYKRGDPCVLIKLNRVSFSLVALMLSSFSHTPIFSDLWMEAWTIYRRRPEGQLHTGSCEGGISETKQWQSVDLRYLWGRGKCYQWPEAVPRLTTGPTLIAERCWQGEHRPHSLLSSARNRVQILSIHQPTRLSVAVSVCSLFQTCPGSVDQCRVQGLGQKHQTQSHGSRGQRPLRTANGRILIPSLDILPVLSIAILL